MAQFRLTFVLTLTAFLAFTATTCAQRPADRPADSQLAQTPMQWEQAYQCTLIKQNDTLASNQTSTQVNLASRVPWWRRLWFKIMHECNRDTSAWRYLYVDEMLGARGFTPRVIERTADERLANIVYSLSLNGLADLSYFKFNSGDPKEDFKNEQLVAGRQVSQQQCDQDLSEMAQQFDELQQRVASIRAGEPGAHLEARHVRLVRTLDTYGRYEAATLTGQTRLMGAYGQCDISLLERRSGAAQNQAVVPMRYCWAKLRTEAHLSEPLTRRRRLAHETGDTSLHVGVCLPRSCHTKTLHKHRRTVQQFVDSQLQLPAVMYANQSVELESVFCLVDPDSEFSMPLSGKLFFVFVGLWLAACCFATYLKLGESQQPQGGMEKEGAKQQKEEESVERPSGKLAEGGLAANLTPPDKQQQHQQHQRAEFKSSKTLRLLSHLNLRISWNEFTSDKRQLSATARVDLDVLNPVKLFACGFCVAAHSALLFATVCGHQGEIAAFVERDYIIQAALFASVVVDTFFVLSGLLLTYVILKKLSAGFGFGSNRLKQQQQQQAFSISTSPTSGSSSRSSSSSSWNVAPRELSNFFANWFVLSLNRYLRLVPLYALMFWFRRDVLTYLGSGPMWDHGFNRNTMNGACKHESSLMPLTPMSAFVPLSQQCFVPSWSVSNDILFAFLLPPIILLLRRRARLGIYVSLSLIVVSVVNSVRGYVGAEPQSRWELGEFRLHGAILFFNGLSDLYSSPVYRTASYLVGSLAGYFLFRYDQQTLNKNHEGQWPGWLKRVATPLALAFLLVHTVCSLRAMEIKALIYPYQRLLAAFFSTLDRPLWAAANAILFLRMTTDWRLGAMMQAWASQTWRTLARLNFALIFTHWIFIVIQNNVLTALPAFTGWQIYAQVASIYAAALPVAILLHVVFENPLDKLLKRELFGL